MDIWSYATEPYGPQDEEAEAAAAARMSETERVLRQEFPDSDSQAWITHCFSECDRAAQAIDQARAEDIRRAAAGRRVLG